MTSLSPRPRGLPGGHRAAAPGAVRRVPPDSRASAASPSTPPTAGGPRSTSLASSTGSGWSTWRCPRPAATRSSTPTGCTPTGLRPCCCTATTTCSRWTRSRSGRRRRSSPLVRDGRILARGASDDKSNITAAVAAAEALLATRGSLPVNLKLVFEGEEESSSVHLDPWLTANAARLARRRRAGGRCGLLRGEPPGGDDRAAGHLRRRDPRPRTVPGRPLRRPRRGDREPDQRARGDHRGAQGSRRPDPHPGLLRRRRDPHARPTGRPSRRCRSTRRPTAPSSTSRPWPARPAGPPSSGAGPARRST